MCIICTSIYTSWQGHVQHSQASRAGLFKIYLALAIVSFATLSFNMLRVLILEHGEWAIDLSPIPYPPTAAHLWKWSEESTLFANFAEQITATPQRWIWAQAELGLSMVTSVWIGLEGRNVNGRGRVPKLWAYFCLLQILPTSIVINLFILARLVHPTAEDSREDERKSRGVVLLRPIYWIATCLAFFSCLFQAGRERHSSGQLIELILIGRCFLFAPLFLPVKPEGPRLSPGSAETGWRMNMVALPVLASILFTCFRLVGIPDRSGSSLGVWRTLSSVWKAKDEHPAVASLGYDAMQGVFSLLLWQATKKRAMTPQATNFK